MISNYIDFKAGNYEYKLRLNVRSIINLEKQLGCNPLAIFGTGETIPPVTTMVQILHASLQAFEHGITLDKSYSIFDSWLEDGHDITYFLMVIIDIYKVSGIMKNDGDKEEKK